MIVLKPNRKSSDIMGKECVKGQKDKEEEEHGWFHKPKIQQRDPEITTERYQTHAVFPSGPPPC